MPAPSVRLSATVLDDLLRKASSTPDAPALIDSFGTTLSFAALCDRVCDAAHSIASAGVQREDPVALILPDGADLITTFLGAASVAPCAVLNPALSPSEMESTLAALSPRLVIRESPELSAPLAPLPPAAATDIALVLQTSATTGKARTVPLTHANLAAMAENTRRTLRLDSSDRFLSMMPLFHLQGLLSSIAQLLGGGAVICTPGFDPEKFLNWMREFRPTWYTAGPALHQAILPMLAAHPEILEAAPLRFVRSIGAPLAPELMDRIEAVLRAPVLEGYGMTEAGAISSNTPDHRRRGSVGRTTGSEIAILDRAGNSVPLGVEGEIAVRGAAVIRAYRDDPEANRASFCNGWFRTGDLGRLDADGFLFVSGRIKDIVNRGGEKIIPAEVEQALLSHPAVAEAAAFGVPHPTLGEDLMCAVVLRPGATATEAELRAVAAEKVARFKVPRRVVIVESIPRTATGKAIRAALAQQFAAMAAPSSEAPRTELERQLASIWTRILKLERAGRDEDFFDLGGDSLTLTLMMAEIDHQFGPEDRSEFLLSPTIETLAGILSRHSRPRRAKSFFVPLQPRGDRTPVYCIPGADENPYYFLDLAKALGEERPFVIVRDPREMRDRGIYTVESHAARFCAEIQAARPAGPIVLAGHCYGGILAFETARQLMAAGREVALLALFEVPTPGYPKVARNWKNYARESAATLRALPDRAALDSIRAHAAVLADLFRRKKQGWTRRVLVSLKMDRAIASREVLDHPNIVAGRAYRLGPLGCPVVHFLAADEEHSTRVLDDPRMGWRDAAPHFSTRSVPGIADGIFRPPHVAHLARELAAVLDSIRIDTTPLP